LEGRIPRSREVTRLRDDDDGRVDELVLDVGIVVLTLGFASWLALSLTILVGRLVYERGRRDQSRPLSRRATERLLRRAGRRRPRSEWARWRRVRALQRLEQAHHPAVPRLMRPVLEDPDPMIAAAAIRTLGDIGDDWAIDVLVDALRRDDSQRSRVASELERLAPAPGLKLLPLLRDWNPQVRFWGATLLRPYPDLGTETLIQLTWDPDPNVRAASVETLGSRTGSPVAAALVARLDDGEWFVRVHAARAAGHVVGAEAAPTITRLLADSRTTTRSLETEPPRCCRTSASSTSSHSTILEARCSSASTRRAASAIARRPRHARKPPRSWRRHA
jgi:hypothetical protein